MIFTRKDKIQSQVSASRRELIRPSMTVVGGGALPPRPPTSTLSNTPKPPATKKMMWGEPTWFLFHTLAEKVKPERFSQIRMELLGVINTICNLLPCPICATHAREYMSKINFNAIQTKDQLKLVLWKFHNTVNERKGYTLFPEAMLYEKYQRANLINIMGVFMHYFEDRPAAGFKQMNDSFHRTRASAHIRTWFMQHMDDFDTSGMSPVDAVV